MTAHDPNAFEPALLDDLHMPASRLKTICRQLVPAYPRRHTIPVLGSALVEAGPKGTTFRVNNLDLQVTITADDLTCAKPFRVCVPFGLLHRMAASLDGVIRITHTPAGKDPERLTLATDDGCSATINLLILADDFPLWTMPKDTDGANDWQPMICSPAELHRHMALAHHCISTEETRYYLNGVHLCRHPERGTLRSVATDGYRMAVIDGPVLAPEALNAILPTGFVRAILTLINAKGNDTVTLAMNTATPRARVTCGRVQIDAKLIDGKFPDYTRVIPKHDTRLTMILSGTALRRMLPFASQRSNCVLFCDGFATMKDPETQGQITVPVQMTAAGDAPRDMTHTAPGGNAETWGFNLGYLRSQAVVTPTFRMEVANPDDPARIYGEDPDALFVIMPMRV